MRSLRIWTDIAEWRWTPAVGLALGAVSYVTLALMIIPDRIGDDQRGASRVTTFQALRSRTSAFAASIAPSLTDSNPSRGDSAAGQALTSPAPPAAAAAVNEADFPRRGFSPPLERTDPPPPPPPPPMPEPIAVPVPPPQAEPPATPPPVPQPETPPLPPAPIQVSPDTQTAVPAPVQEAPVPPAPNAPGSEAPPQVTPPPVVTQ